LLSEPYFFEFVEEFDSLTGLPNGTEIRFDRVRQVVFERLHHDEKRNVIMVKFRVFLIQVIVPFVDHHQFGLVERSYGVVQR